MDRLISLIKKLNSPCVVGLDTKLSFIPQYIKKAALEEFGNSSTAAAFAITVFNKKIIDCVKILFQFIGKTLTGKLTHTFCKGVLIYKNI